MREDIKCMQDKCIDIQKQKLINEGLKENVDFRIVHYNQTKEIKFIKRG